MTVIKGGASGSGMYELKPVRLSARSSFVKFTDETEKKLSAQRRLHRLVAPIALVYGSLETPEFQRQRPRFLCGGEGGRQAGHAFGHGGLQPLRGSWKRSAIR